MLLPKDITKLIDDLNELIISVQSIPMQDFRRKLKMEYISENFDEATFESLLNDHQQE